MNGVFQVIEGIEALEAGAALEAGEIEMGLARAVEVEENAAVAEMAEAPAIAEGPGAVARVTDFLTTNTYGKAMWAFAKWAAKASALASAIFAVTYGLNKAIAKDAHETGKRTALSQYLIAVQNNWVSNLKLPWKGGRGCARLSVDRRQPVTAAGRRQTQAFKRSTRGA